MSNAQLSPKVNDLRSIITSDKMKQQFAAALPQHLTPDRFCRIALTALTRTPKLADCTQESLMRCLLDLSAYGIEPDGRRAHLIPYGNQCTLILDWKGLAELAMRSGIIAKLHADIVCENDVFEYNLGEVVQHKIDFKAPRGEMYAAYAMAVTKDGPVFVAVLNKDEIDGIRKRSKSGNSGPWQTDYNEMAKKTAFRRLAKWLPLSAEFRDAVDKDDDVVIERDVTPKTAARATPLDPFASLPEAPGQTLVEHTDDTPVVEAEVVEQPADDMDDPALLDFLDQIQGCEDAAALTKLVKPANDGFEGAKQAIAKRAISAKADKLGVKWVGTKEKGEFKA
jgi:recombination protein RecT